MIVRILGEGQYRIPDGERSALEVLDSRVGDAVDGDDEQVFASALAALSAEVRRLGEPLPDDTFETSDLVVPFPDATLDETKGLLAQSADRPRADD